MGLESYLMALRCCLLLLILSAFASPIEAAEYNASSGLSLIGQSGSSRLTPIAFIRKSPAVKFKELETAITSGVQFNTLPIQVRADFMRITAYTTQTNVTILMENKNLRFQRDDGMARTAVNVYGRITSSTGRVV